MTKQDDQKTYLKRKLVEQNVNLQGRAITTRLDRAAAQAAQEAQEKYPDNQAHNALITQRISRLLGWLAVFFVGLFLVAGNLISLILFPVAEFMAVRAGIMAFEAHAELATLNAAVVVIGLVSILFIRNLLRDNLPDNAPVPSTSLKRTWQGLRHFVTGRGLQDDMLATQALYLAASGAVTLLQVVIVLLGFMGRVRDAMTASAANGETYYTFLIRLVVDASAVEMLGYIGTIFLTIALLRVTDLVVLFIYNVFTSTVGTLALQADDKGALRRRFFDLRRAELEVEMLHDYLIQIEARNKQRD
jgi:hypothetical protein